MKNGTARIVSSIAFALLLTALAFAQTTPAPDSDQEISARLSRALGVPVDRITLHFYLVKAGGVTEITAKDPQDAAAVAAIQKYLQNQKELWEKGKDPVVEVHSKPPESVATLRKMRNEITFYVAKTDTGGVLRMFSINDQARTAIQDFMRFEIAEHKTGDSPTTDQ